MTIEHIIGMVKHLIKVKLFQESIIRQDGENIRQGIAYSEY